MQRYERGGPTGRPSCSRSLGAAGNDACTFNAARQTADNERMAIGRCRTAVSARADSEAGFTLIELLVVILIIGILAGVAIPAFLSQKEKATDAAAKEQSRTAQTATEAYSTDHGGSYAGMSTAELQT